MKKIVISLVVIACLLSLGVGCASADTVNANWLNQNFPDLKNHVGSEVTVSNPVLKYSGNNPQEVVELHRESNAKGYEIGWYPASDPSKMNPIKNNFMLNGITNFGLYLSTDGKTYWTQQNILPNTDKSLDAKIFKMTEGDSDKVIVCFETGVGDPDYKDYILWIKPVSVSVPEFPTMALPVAAVLGLLFISGRRRKE